MLVFQAAMANIILAVPLQDLRRVCEKSAYWILPVESARIPACVHDCFAILVVAEIGQQIIDIVVTEHKRGLNIRFFRVRFGP